MTISYHIANLILYFEMLLMIGTIVFLIFFRMISRWKKKRGEQRKGELSSKILHYLNKKTQHRKKRFYYQGDFLELLQVVESFEHRLNAEEWQILKKEIVDHSLRPKAKKLATSRNWQKRALAARIFRLAPTLQEEDLLLLLIQDPSFFVRSFAAAAALSIASPRLIHACIEQMGREKGYARYFFNDLLASGSKEVLDHLIDYAKKGKEPLVCLEVLGARTLSFPLTFLETYLTSTAIDVQRAALQVFVRNPQREAVTHFIKHAKNTDEKIRVIAAKGLGFFPHEIGKESLTQFLHDPSWQVRWEAAKSLRKQGAWGLLLKEGGEMTDYILRFG